MATINELMDYYLLDELFTPEERMARDTIAKFVQEAFLPKIVDAFRNGYFPRELIPVMGELGLFGSNLQGYGCAGMSNVAYGLCMQQLEAGDSGLRSTASVQGSLAMYPIHAFGTEEQKKKFLPEMAAGRLIGCFGLTEPDHGSDPAGMKTRAVKDGSNWILNGEKMWITNGHISDVAIVWAKTGADEKSIRGFLVERDRPGFEARDISGKFSLRASITSSLSFTDCKVPDSMMLPDIMGLRGPLSCLNQARYGISWGCTGAMMDCFRRARAYALERTAFGKPIAGFQLVQRKLADVFSELVKAQMLCWRLGRLKDEGRATPGMISLAKRNNAEKALWTARLLREVMGANGITDEYHIIRHALNLESVFTYEGTHDIHTLIIGKEITGLSAFE
ncbi:MAG: Acyl-CoA dehydrogenase [Myxococcota bacterium]|nr:Acyl-CoA dehydrogenase [Myxococcota bacterium]